MLHCNDQNSTVRVLKPYSIRLCGELLKRDGEHVEEEAQ